MKSPLPHAHRTPASQEEGRRRPQHALQRHLLPSRRGATAANAVSEEGRGAAAAPREDPCEGGGRLGGERECEAAVAVLEQHRGVAAAEAASAL
eukprot:scaffold106354_cov36-Phaeocystis_antarctica.AAC.1